MFRINHRIHNQRDAHRPPPDRCAVLAVASGGGHWVQLMRLTAAFENHDVTYVSVNPEYAAQVSGSRFHIVRDATRWNRLGLVLLGMQLLQIVWRERPDVIITTGAAPGLLALIIGRRFGARTLWIDSIANVDQISMSGRHALRVADVCLTQWPELAKQSGLEYRGSVL